jgi:hypothetical protein
MSVRAKFRCHTTPDPAGDVDHFSYRVKLVPVMVKSKTGEYGPGGENAAFFAATPSGEIEFVNLAESAARHFVPGQAYYIDFTPTDG